MPDQRSQPTGTGPIRVAIDGRPLAGPPCGYTIYLASILTCLRSPLFEVTLLGDRPPLAQYPEAYGTPTAVFGRHRALGWEQRDLPVWLAEHRPDVYFSAANRGIPVRKRPRTRYVLGLLDVIPFLFFRDYYVRRWKAFLRRPTMVSETAAQLVAIARADTILTISRQSAEDIRRLFRRRDVSARLIRLRDVEPRRSGVPRRQFVYVGGLDPRKRVDRLLEGFARLLRDTPDLRLVLVGSNFEPVRPLIAQLELVDHVELTGFVDDDTKYRLLSGSLAMVYPSLYEGYGLAIAEGFQAGIPVIAGRGGSQAEIGGDAVRAIDPCSAADIAAAMAEMLDPELRADWIERGRTQLARLTDPAIEAETAAFFLEQGRLARRD